MNNDLECLVKLENIIKTKRNHDPNCSYTARLFKKGKQKIANKLGEEAFEIALKHGDVTFVPLETIKGLSINDAWLICEEASDLTRDEVIKLITRMGKNSVLVLAGDVRQSELKDSSGLVWLRDFIKRHDLSDNFGFIDFNETSDIVRSDAVKRFITALVRDEKENK